MLSINKRYVFGRYAQGEAYNSTHKREVTAGHEGYLAHEAEPKDRLNDSNNLFHDSNSQNGKWLKLVRTYLANSRRL
jgi:hypothetical protein